MVLFCFGIIALMGCSKKDQVFEQQEFKMDTIMNLKAYGSKAENAVKEAYNRIDEIEQMASAQIATSDVSMINTNAGKEYVKVNPEIILMLKTAVKYSELSEGAFDITVGPLIKLWGIGSENERIPSDTEIKEALTLVGYKNISINEEDNSVMLLKEGMSIDLGGIAKGYAADEVVKIFKNKGIKSALINLGGSSMYTLGLKPDDSLWSIAIQHPRKDKNGNYAGIIKMSDQALSTSGDYERYFISDGKRYHHIMNPFTGYPADAGVMSDTIVISGDNPNGNMLADILTKVTFVSGTEKGLSIIDSLEGVECLAITTSNKIYKSSGWTLGVEDVSSDFIIMN
ncbi:MAG: thiamine biosynthesis protein ApbE [Anaerocolumna sp.]|jgi:thiamine biosynthesis lipoprotein|nr:thiamine biosynthesis protein ApbE [Anaerocolumna sp.]